MRLQYNYNDSCSANQYLIQIQLLSKKKTTTTTTKKNRQLFSTTYLGYLKCSPKKIHRQWSIRMFGLPLKLIQICGRYTLPQNHSLFFSILKHVRVSKINIINHFGVTEFQDRSACFMMKINRFSENRFSISFSVVSSDEMAQSPEIFFFLLAFRKVVRWYK